MTQAFQLKGVHVAAMIAAFFATEIVVNTYFITTALNTFPGEDEPKSYVQGLHYNDTLNDRAHQAALGWRAEAGMAPGAAGGAKIQVRVFARSGEALTGLHLTGVLRRPANAKRDQTLTFRADGDGYVADASAVDDGLWELRVRADNGENHFDLARSLAWRRLPI